MAILMLKIFQKQGKIYADKATVLSADTNFEGNLEGEGDVVLKGRFDGQIKVTGDVHVEKGASVHSTVEARSIYVNGKIEGHLKASGLLKIGSGGIVAGEIEINVLSIEAGGTLNGQCNMVTRSEVGIPIRAVASTSYENYSLVK